jgi:hypothetical protein
MAEAETLVDYTDYDADADRVESVTVVKTDDDEYPSGWKYRLHYGTTDGETLVRYDNSHERSKGHERHEGDSTEEVEFTSMDGILRRFYRDVDGMK